jgi:hypothetical protein
MRPPIADEHSQAYWDGAANGRLLIQRCTSCGARQFYPRRHCTACFAPEPEWVEAAGTGRLHTYTVVHRTPNPEFAGEAPYVLAIVQLDEGVRVSARILDVPHEELVCDMRVRVVFTPLTDGITLPNFTKEPR